MGEGLNQKDIESFLRMLNIATDVQLSAMRKSVQGEGANRRLLNPILAISTEVTE